MDDYEDYTSLNKEEIKNISLKLATKAIDEQKIIFDEVKKGKISIEQYTHIVLNYIKKLLIANLKWLAASEMDDIATINGIDLKKLFVEFTASVFADIAYDIQIKKLKIDLEIKTNDDQIKNKTVH